MAKTPTVAGAKPAEKSQDDLELDGLMSEIESGLREDELKKIWEQYKGVMVVFIVALLVSVAGFQFWRQYEDKSRMDVAVKYDAAAKSLDEGKLDDAIKGFGTVTGAKLAGGYDVLARLGEAAGYVKKGDEANAVKIYAAVAADGSIDPAFRDLATVLRALHSIDTADPKELEAALGPITSPDNPFRFTALELSALLSAKQGNTAHASQLVERILGDPTAPTGVRQRATDLAGLYKPVTPVAAAAPVAAPAAPAPAAAPVPAKP